MKEKIKKYIKIIFFNIFLFLIFLYICDYIIYSIETSKLKSPLQRKERFLSNIFKPEISLTNYTFTGKNDYGYGYWDGRKPEGLEYTNKTPIIILGCSFAYGQYLYTHQTLSYKLAKTLKRPIYNRGLSGSGPQHMYYQITNENFFKEVPESDTIIHIIIDDHYRRMLGEMFKITDPILNLHYTKKDNSLIMDNYDNYLLNLFRYSHTCKYIRYFYKNRYIKNPKNADKLTDELMLYFIKIREKLEEKWGNKINYNVILYERILYNDLLEEKLKKNGFNVIKTDDITSENLNTGTYKMLDNGHPSEAAWDLLTPIIIKEFNL